MLFQKDEKYRMLTENQCEQVMDAVYNVLENVGCLMKNSKAREIMANAGCTVEDELVKIPKSLMKNAIESVPETITLYNRFGEEAFTLAPGETFFGPHLGCPNTIDVDTAEYRPYVEADAANFAMVSEALPNMKWIAALGQISDVDARVCDVHEARAIIANSTKPVTTWAITPESLKDIYEMCEVVCGGHEALKEKPMIFVGMCPVNCLTHGEAEIEIFMTAAEYGLPLLYTPGMMIGVQAPVTIPGGLVISLSDTFVGLLLSQLINKGMPFVASSFLDSVDMKKLALTMTDPEINVANLCVADVFRHLNIPFCCHGLTSDANEFDQQAAADGAMGIYTAILGGCNMVIHAGYLGGGLCSSLECLVYDDEVISMIRSIEKGVDINEETLALDVIAKVGPNGSYINEDHTLDNYGELWNPTVFNRDNYKQWNDSGKPSIYSRMNKKVKDIIAKGPKSPLPQDQLDKLDAIVARAEARELK